MIILLLLVRATYIWVLFFTHIPFVVNHTINATPPERLQHPKQSHYVGCPALELLYNSLCGPLATTLETYVLQ